MAIDKRFLPFSGPLRWKNLTQLTSSSFSFLFAFSLFLTFFSLFSGALCLSFSRCFSLDIHPFTWAFPCPLLRSSRRFPSHFFSCRFSSFHVFPTRTPLLLLLSLSGLFSFKSFHRILKLKWFLPVDLT